jgi:hypothetical protein
MKKYGTAKKRTVAKMPRTLSSHETIRRIEEWGQRIKSESSRINQIKAELSKIESRKDPDVIKKPELEKSLKCHEYLLEEFRIIEANLIKLREKNARNGRE